MKKAIVTGATGFIGSVFVETLVKRNIKVLRREFLTQYILDMKGELEYTKSSQFVNKKLKNT